MNALRTIVLRVLRTATFTSSKVCIQMANWFANLNIAESHTAIDLWWSNIGFRLRSFPGPTSPVESSHTRVISHLVVVSCLPSVCRTFRDQPLAYNWCSLLWSNLKHAFEYLRLGKEWVWRMGWRCFQHQEGAGGKNAYVDVGPNHVKQLFRLDNFRDWKSAVVEWTDSSSSTFSNRLTRLCWIARLSMKRLHKWIWSSHFNVVLSSYCTMWKYLDFLSFIKRICATCVECEEVRTTISV